MAAPGPGAHEGAGEASKMPDLAALQNLQSMDWLLKKERIFLLAQFWQQVSENAGTNEGHRGYNEIVSKLVEDISRLQAALSGVKEATAVQMHALEEQLELKNRLIHRLELKLENSKDQEDIKRDLGSGRDSRGPLDVGLCLPPRSLEGLLIDRKLDQEIKVPSSEFGNSLSHFGPSPFPHPLRHPLHPQLGTPLAPPPLISPLQPLAPHPPPGTPLHHLLGEEWRKSYERSALDRHVLVSGQVSPDSGGLGGVPSAAQSERSESRESPAGDGNMKSPSLANGYGPESKSPFQSRDDRSPFKDDMHPLAFKFEDRITGESLIPKGDPMEAKLQELLRYNMEKYCHQNLDTLNISRRVRELLSIHNIGQRLFAKYVLGLSQGTVSELLSKPKPWDKLTEKGRDSYRKMHAWATDDGAVFLLKSLIPKKGSHKDGNLRAGEENVTEERIQHILSEASRAMTSSVALPGNTGLGPLPQPSQHPPPSSQSQQQPLPLAGGIDQDSRSTDSKSPASSTHSPSPLSRENRIRIRKEGEDMSQDKVARLYQEELMKLMSRTHQHDPHLPLHRDPQYPGLLFPFLGQSFLFNRGQEEMKMALDAYHQELSKIQGASVTGMGLGAAGLGIGHPAGMGVVVGPTPPVSMGMSLGAGGHNGAQDLSLPKRDHRNGEEEEDSGTRLPSVASPFGPSRIKPENNISVAMTMSTNSPLTNLVTPINSIASISSTCSSSSNGSGGLDDTITTTASPLQRMASITNSLITGPPMSGGIPMNQKPMKAVLPPITQQQFDQYSSMNTEDIVKKIKEQLSQYSISQRLFGESVLGLSQGSVSDLLARPKPWHMLTQKGREPFIRMKMFLEDDNAVHKLVASQYKIAPEKLMRTGGYGIPPPCTMKPHHIKLPPDLPKCMESQLPPIGIPSSLGLTLSAHHPHPYDTRMPLLDPLRKVFPFQTGMPSIRVPGPVAPSVYEMAALTQDLDTQVITTKIKEALLANNIGQKLFGEAVLGLSQGSVSELLSKPKPWHMLSIKGREPFIRMQLWLNDPHNVEKLQTLKNERREANKRRRGLDPSAEVSPDSHDIFQAPSPGGSSKKARVLFSEEQKEALRLAFALDPYPNLAAIEFLSQELQLSTRTITNWFHNHRMRLKQHPGSPDGSMSPPRDLPPSQTPFDPLHFRIMLSQRLMELRKEKGLPPTLPGLGAGLPPNIHPGFFSPMPPFSMANLSISHSDRYASSGLDLSMKSEHDGDDSNASFIDDDSNLSGGMSPNGNRSDGDDFIDDQDGHGSTSPIARPSSRRKPVAPQWVNPSWAVGTGGEKEREVIINGVCVMQTDDYRQNNEQETVLIEPTSVEEARRSMLEGAPTPDVEERTCLSDSEVAVCPVSLKEESPKREEENDVSNLSKSDHMEVNGGSEYQNEPLEDHQVKTESEDA